MGELTHFNSAGQAHMVDGAAKPDSHRVAIAVGRIVMRPETLQKIQEGTASKGDVLGIARVAAIQGAKRTSELIPLCHPISLSSMSIEFKVLVDDNTVECSAQAETVGRTGEKDSRGGAPAPGGGRGKLPCLSRHAVGCKGRYVGKYRPAAGSDTGALSRS